MGGTVSIQNLKDIEKNAFKRFFCKDYTDKKSASISASAVEKALLNTKYEEFYLFDILESYFDEKLVSKSQLKKDYVISKQDYFEEIFVSIKNENVRQWFRNVISNKISPYNVIIQKYANDKKDLKIAINFVAQAVHIIINKENFKNDFIRLAVFATDITGNPHYFDEGNYQNKILTSALCFFSSVKEPNTAEEKAELFYKYNVIKDDISIYTVCYGLEALDKNNVKHLGWSGFSNRFEPLHVSLANISQIERVISNKKVYVVENPTVFSVILDSCAKRNIEADPFKFSMICSNGQPRLSTLILMDKLAKEDAIFYYAGDFDPEGILIADRLKKRYGGRLLFWNTTISDYIDSLSNEKLNDLRLNKLNKVESEELKEVVDKMRDIKISGYQEKIIYKYVESILDKAY